MSKITWEKLINQLTKNARVDEEVEVVLYMIKKRDRNWHDTTYPVFPPYKIEPKEGK